MFVNTKNTHSGKHRTDPLSGTVMGAGYIRQSFHEMFQAQ